MTHHVSSVWNFALVSQTSFGGKNSGSVAKCRLFSLASFANFMVNTRRLFQTWGEVQAKTQDKVEWRRLIAALQRIQVKRLMTSVIAFVITVDWLRCEANCQTLQGGDDIVLSEERLVVLSISLCTDVPLPQEKSGVEGGTSVHRLLIDLARVARSMVSANQR